MDQPGNHILPRNNQPGAADRMRELLARTVQDHVSDQQSNSGALEDIRQRMEGLEWLVRDGRERELPGLQAVGDAVGRVLDTLRAQDERLTTLQHSLSKLQQSMETAAGRFSRLDEALEAMTERLGSADARVTALDARLERLDERLDDQYDRVSAIDNTLAAADIKLGAIGTAMERADGRLGEVSGQLGAVDGRLGEVSGWLADELRSRPGPTEITAGVAAIVDAAQRDITAHLGSLEETVLTLAEALLRPAARTVPGAHAGTRG